MAPAKPYNAVHVALIWWQENDFSRAFITNKESLEIFGSNDAKAKAARIAEGEKKGVELELKDFGEAAKKSLDATVTITEISIPSFIVPSKNDEKITNSGNKSEDFLLSELKAFYTKIGVPKEQELVILVYSGHGAPGPCGPNTLKKTGYRPKGGQTLLWSA